MNISLCKLLILLTFAVPVSGQEPFSGIYPHLGYFNDESECGTGAVVPWADRLWVITYGAHHPQGSSDKLYEITSDLELITRAESVGGTPANRMIHQESQQLNIGPYFIDKDRNVRVITPKRMPGRLTGTARHLTDPANKLYVATMEEGLYEIDVHDLSVTELIKDGNGQPAIGDGVKSELDGAHGKGLYSGQGQLIFANNGDKGPRAKIDPFVRSGALASWQGASDWKLIRRNQFTEVTGPGGIYGSEHPNSDPLWTVGWDARSLILMTLNDGTWHSFRLPKASHSYDGAHGWNTEWPRIRDIGEDDLLMTMHGMFWRFPKAFAADNSGGIAPRSNYLKVVGDFCRWQDRIVLGCDDTAKHEFLNRRKAKGHVAAPQSQSNLWFLKPEMLDRLGPVIGRGAVWLNDPVKANTPSDPFLINGFTKRAIHFSTDKPTTITLEIDAKGDGTWTEIDKVQVDGYAWKEIDPALDAAWMRLQSSADLNNAIAWFHLAGEDDRVAGAATEKFDGVARVGETNVTGGLVRPRAKNNRTLQFAAADANGEVGLYTLNANAGLTTNSSKSSSNKEFDWMQKHAAIPSREGVIEVDQASVIYIDDDGKRFRLPQNLAFGQTGTLGLGRLCREVATERDLFNCWGTFYELPARNAAGFSRLRPVASHNLDIKDYCSYRGLLVLSGVNLKAAQGNRHVRQSADSKTGLWVGAIDDIWELGKPVGVGGPWLNTNAAAGVVSDPYLMTGYDKKTLKLSSSAATRITAEVDISGMGDWQPYKTFDLDAGKTVKHEFPSAFQAYWIRFKTDSAATTTAQLTYE